jgi:hypothetical protein
MVKTQKYTMLGFLLFTFLATLGLTGQDIPKTQQSRFTDLAKDDKPLPISKWASDMWKSFQDLYESDEKLVHLVVLLRSKYTTDSRDTLKGFHGVRVLVEGLKPEVEKYGLTKEAIQTDTELRLRQYGIKVLSPEESGGSWLYINVNTVVQEGIPIAAIAVQVEFRQDVLLFRDLKTRVMATTWDKGVVIVGGASKLKDVRESVKDLVDAFINDYLAVNPKEQPPAEKDSKVKE